MYTAVLHFITSDRSLFVQDLFINNTLKVGNYEHAELTASDNLWIFGHYNKLRVTKNSDVRCNINPYPTAFPYGNGMVLHFYQQQESSTTKTVHKVINKGLKTYA